MQDGGEQLAIAVSAAGPKKRLWYLQAPSFSYQGGDGGILIEGTSQAPRRVATRRRRLRKVPLRLRPRSLVRNAEQGGRR
jgi:hypothetical protein